MPRCMIHPRSSAMMSEDLRDFSNMNEIEEKNERSYEILIYGIEKVGLRAPDEPVHTRNFRLHFEPFSTRRRFPEFDGVILYQGIFESFEWKPGLMNNYLEHSCDNNELDKRKKEAQLLVRNGGFLCFLLNQPFRDHEDGKDFMGSDLAKYHLNYEQFHRGNFGQRIAQLNIKSDEFRKFLEIYGAASSYFRHYNKSIEWRIIAEAADLVAGMVIDRNEFFIPTLIPDKRAEVIIEYFTLLADALTSTYNKLYQEPPGWIAEFEFANEEKIYSERTALEARIAEIDQLKSQLSCYKSVLALSGDALVASVVRVFEGGFGISVDTRDELREDFKLLDNQGAPFCLCEVKGTNKSLKREHVNQADSHRERSGFVDNFPVLVIINTHIKYARSVAEKDQEIAHEQIRHARNLNILILRTIDLLRMLRFCLNGQIRLDEFKSLVTSNSGWLRVTDIDWTIISGMDASNTV